MRFVVRMVGVVAVTGLLSGCDADTPAGPETGDVLLAAIQPNNSVSSAAPSTLTSTAGQPGEIDLAWRDNSDNEAGFEVQRASGGPDAPFSPWTTTAPNTTATSVTGLGPSQTHCFKVRAFVTKGKQRQYTEFSNTSCATTLPPSPPAPNPPSGTGATPVNSTSVAITWMDNSSDEEGFRVERAVGGCVATWVTAATTGANVTSFIDVGRVPDQAVCYRVRSFKGPSASAPSVEAATVPPAAPTNLTASRVSATPHRAIDLTWLDQSSAEDGFQIQRAETAGGPYQVVTYVGANSTTYRDTALAASTTYWYRVRAGRNAGFSDFSNEASATTDAAPAATAPAAPEAVSAVPGSSTFAFITWTDRSWNEDGFRIERSLDGGASWTFAGSAAVGEEFFHDSGESEVERCYRVTAFNAQGASAPSNVDCTKLPAAPSDARVTAAGVFTWKDNSGVETGYEIWYFNEAIGTEFLASLPANSQSYDPTSRPSGFYWIYATYEGGRSDEALFVEVSADGSTSLAHARHPTSAQERHLVW